MILCAAVGLDIVNGHYLPNKSTGGKRQWRVMWAVMADTVANGKSKYDSVTVDRNNNGGKECPNWLLQHFNEKGYTASAEESHPAKLTLRLHVDFTALGQLYRKTRGLQFKTKRREKGGKTFQGQFSLKKNKTRAETIEIVGWKGSTSRLWFQNLETYQMVA